MFENKQALLVVDVQVDFCEGGVLGVKDSAGLFLRLNSLIKEEYKKNTLIIFTKDMHGDNHCSFEKNGGMWAEHCKVGTEGANFHKNLYMPPVFLCVHKGEEDNLEGYSAFDGTNLHDILLKCGIRDIVLTGIAAEYCVLQSALDAKKLGYQVSLIKDLVRFVNNSEENMNKIWNYYENNNIVLV